MVCRAGLALAGSRSVKNACRVGASAVELASRRGSSRRPQGEQLRSGGQVPVGGVRVDVAEIGGQQGQAGLHVLPGSIGVEQAADGEGMSVMREFSHKRH